jgi:lantibiotic modifying enzyme
VEHRACGTEEEAQRFFENSGKLLALAQCLGFNDGHQENVVACGEHPVLIDVETLFLKGVPSDLEQSIFSTGLLQERPVAYEPQKSTFVAAFQVGYPLKDGAAVHG